MLIGFIGNLKIPIESLVAIATTIDMDEDGCVSVKEIWTAIKKAVKRAKE